MNPVIEKLVQPVVDGSVNLATESVKRSRMFAETSSDWVANSTKDVAKVSSRGLKLNKISHNMLARLLTEQSHMIEGSLKAVAKRLDVAANADSFTMLWSDQMGLLPKTRDRLTKDSRKLVAVFTDTGGELRSWASEIVKEMSQRGDSVVKQTRKTTATTVKKTRKRVSTAAKTTKKKVSKASKPARKTAKKRTRRAA